MCNSDNFPVFVVGSARSGTTLLYSILLSSGEFAIYQAETLLLDVCEPKYGNLRREKNYKKFIEDWTNSKQFFRAGLDPLEFRREATRYRESYLAFLRFYMERIAQKQRKKRWVEQTPGHLFHMERLSKAFPNAKFIHVIRDGRDVAVSKRKIGWSGTKSANPLKKLLCAAKGWEISVNKGQARGKKLGDSYLEIRYEDIINKLDEVLKKIGRFALINIDQNKIRHSCIGSLGRGNTAFDDKVEGISKRGLGRWKTKLTEEEMRALNITIGKTLTALGYEVDDVTKTSNSLVFWKIKGYSTIFHVLFCLKRIVRQKTFLGRFTSSSLELDQV